MATPHEQHGVRGRAHVVGSARELHGGMPIPDDDDDWPAPNQTGEMRAGEARSPARDAGPRPAAEPRAHY